MSPAACCLSAHGRSVAGLPRNAIDELSGRLRRAARAASCRGPPPGAGTAKGIDEPESYLDRKPRPHDGNGQVARFRPGRRAARHDDVDLELGQLSKRWDPLQTAF